MFFAKKSNMLKHQKKEGNGASQREQERGHLSTYPKGCYFFYLQSSCRKNDGYSNTNINKQLILPPQNTPAPQAKANIADVSVNTLLY